MAQVLSPLKWLYLFPRDPPFSNPEHVVLQDCLRYQVCDACAIYWPNFARQFNGHSFFSGVVTWTLRFLFGSWVMSWSPFDHILPWQMGLYKGESEVAMRSPANSEKCSWRIVKYYLGNRVQCWMHHAITFIMASRKHPFARNFPSENKNLPCRSQNHSRSLALGCREGGA